jgi:Domain of unknown function (DUF397)
MDDPAFTWVKSSYSSSGNCVEVAATDHVLVRDTNNRAGAVVRFSPAAWRRFVGQVKAGARSV